MHRHSSLDRTTRILHWTATAAFATAFVMAQFAPAAGTAPIPPHGMVGLGSGVALLLMLAWAALRQPPRSAAGAQQGSNGKSGRALALVSVALVLVLAISGLLASGGVAFAARAHAVLATAAVVAIGLHAVEAVWRLTRASSAREGAA